MEYIFITPNTLSTFVGDKNIALTHGYIAITQEQYEALCNEELQWIDGVLCKDGRAVELPIVELDPPVIRKLRFDKQTHQVVEVIEEE